MAVVRWLDENLWIVYPTNEPILVILDQYITLYAIQSLVIIFDWVWAFDQTLVVFFQFESFTSPGLSTFLHGWHADQGHIHLFISCFFLLLHPRNRLRLLSWQRWHFRPEWRWADRSGRWTCITGESVRPLHPWKVLTLSGSIHREHQFNAQLRR